MKKRFTRPRKPGSKQPYPYYRREKLDDGRERWVHPSVGKVARTATVGLFAGLLGYFFLPQLFQSTFSMFAFDFIRTFKTDLIAIFSGVVDMDSAKQDLANKSKPGRT